MRCVQPGERQSSAALIAEQRIKASDCPSASHRETMLASRPRATSTRMSESVRTITGRSKDQVLSLDARAWSASQSWSSRNICVRLMMYVVHHRAGCRRTQGAACARVPHSSKARRYRLAKSSEHGGVSLISTCRQHRGTAEARDRKTSMLVGRSSRKLVCSRSRKSHVALSKFTLGTS